MTNALRRQINVRNGLLLVAIVAWSMFLRPQWLGGPATFVLVRGDSMEPTYQNGDFLLAYPQSSYAVGDIVAYKVPSGEVGGGHLVVHRISGATDGGFQLQGDNNPASDPWIATPTDLMGRVVVRVPAVGLVLAYLLQPVIAGGLAAAIVVMFGVARSTKPTSGAEKRGSVRDRSRPVGLSRLGTARSESAAPTDN